MKNIAIICGGDSGEYEISIKSGRVVSEHLDKSKYNGWLVEIKGEDWFYQGEDGKKHFIDKNDFSLTVKGERISFDGVFNAIHGTPGEDGKMQGYLDMLDIPYTSCGVDSSALSFNKHLCNRFISAYGISVANSVVIRKGEKVDRKQVIDNLGLPLFVKPARSGSSVGVSKVHKEDDFDEAVRKALAEDDQVLVEEYIEGRELACGLINKGEELIVFPLTEIISKKDFFDYEAKYTEGLAHEVTPAKVDVEVEQDVKTLSAFLFRQMGCKGFVRFDYILSDKGLYFLEVNAIPGMTEASLLPQMANAFGMSITELFTIALDNLFE
jgi:D-alanine-D-alanine ligase